MRQRLNKLHNSLHNYSKVYTVNGNVQEKKMKENRQIDLEEYPVTSTIGQQRHEVFWHLRY